MALAELMPREIKAEAVTARWKMETRKLVIDGLTIGSNYKIADCRGLKHIWEEN
jgi:hypothetical protein